MKVTISRCPICGARLSGFWRFANGSLLVPCLICRKEFLVEEGRCTVKLPLRYKRELGFIRAMLDYLAAFFIRDRALCAKPAVCCFFVTKAGTNVLVFKYFCAEHRGKAHLAALGYIPVTDEVRWR